MVHGQAFCIITWKPPSRGLPVSAPQGRTGQLCGFEPRNPSPVLRNQYRKASSICGRTENLVGLRSGDIHQYSEINIEKLPQYVDALRTWWVCALGTFTSTQKPIQ